MSMGCQYTVAFGEKTTRVSALEGGSRVASKERALFRSEGQLFWLSLTTIILRLTHM